MFPRLTPIIKNLLIINVLVFVVLQLPFGKQLWEYFVLVKLDVILNHTPSTAKFFQPVQLVTYFFNHGGLWHIAINMFVLASFGPLMEGVMGSKVFLRFYLFCGIFGGLLILFFDPSAAPVVGSSVALSGVLVAFAIYFPHQRLSLLFIPIYFKARDFVIGFAVISALFVFLQFKGTTSGGGISHFGHLAGMIAAVAFFYLARVLPFLKQ